MWCLLNSIFINGFCDLLQLELVACATASESGCPTTAASAVESKSSMSVQEAASLLIDWGCECVVATRGALGASIFIRDKSSEKRFIEISEPAVELLVRVLIRFYLHRKWLTSTFLV